VRPCPALLYRLFRASRPPKGAASRSRQIKRGATTPVLASAPLPGWPGGERPQLAGVSRQLLHIGALGGGGVGVPERCLHRVQFQAVAAAGGRGEAVNGVGVPGPVEGVQVSFQMQARAASFARWDSLSAQFVMPGGGGNRRGPE